MKKLLKAVKEGSISVACLLDDVAVNNSEELNLTELQKDIEHLQDQITIIENYLDPFVIEELIGKEKITGVVVKNFETKELEEINCHEILFLFGLNKKLGPIAEWGIDMKDKKVSVDTEKYETSTQGLFAVGDINDYPGKLDLILCGFHETTLAVQEAFRRCHPGERVPFGYTTSNTKLQRKLGIND